MTSFYTICCYMHKYVYIYIPKYNLCSLYSATCMYVFRAVHRTLGNQFECSLPRKSSSSALSFPQLPIGLCVGLRPCRLFSVLLVCLLVSFFLGSSLGSRVGETLSIQLLMLLVDTISQQTFQSLASIPFSSMFLDS